MRGKFLIFLCGLFCFFSEQAVAAAATSAPEFYETEEYKRWTKLAAGVEKRSAPFNLPSFFTTQTETVLLVKSVKETLRKLEEGVAVPKIGREILDLVEGYKEREPKHSWLIFYKDGRLKETHNAELFSVPSKLDIFPPKNVSRADIYKTVAGIVSALGALFKI